jgi:hypothetical protein
MVLAATFRSRALSLAKNRSMGLKSGLYGLDGFAEAGDFCGYNRGPGATPAGHFFRYLRTVR